MACWRRTSLAPSLAVLGESDFAARLPSVLEGVALIPIAFLLGREVAGRAGGLFVAALLAGHPSFVDLVAPGVVLLALRAALRRDALFILLRAIERAAVAISFWRRRSPG